MLAVFRNFGRENLENLILAGEGKGTISGRDSIGLQLANTTRERNVKPPCLRDCPNDIRGADAIRPVYYLHDTMEALCE